MQCNKERKNNRDLANFCAHFGVSGSEKREREGEKRDKPQSCDGVQEN